MAVITEGQLALIDRSPVFRAVGLEFMPLSDGTITTYDAIYKYQPAVRAVVDFLSKNLGQLRMKTYARVNDSDREFLREHPTQQLLDFPSGRLPHTLTDNANPSLALMLARDRAMGRRLTRSRFFRNIWADYLIYDRLLIVKIRSPLTDQTQMLQRIPPRMYRAVGTNWIAPDGFQLRGSGEEIDILPSDAIYITGYNPLTQTDGISPIESLRRTLDEDAGMARYRTRFWDRAAQYSSIIQRPIDAPQWSSDARERFREKWRAAGRDRASGGVGILEEGMTYHDAAFTGDVSSYAESRKLSNEEVARAWNLPRALVDMLDTGNGPWSAGIDAYRQFLYSEVLAPLLPIMSEQMELDLLAEREVDAGDSRYIEYDIDEKLRGNFEVQLKGAQASVGAPWRTRNEQRAMENLPSVEGGDELITPLNVMVGSQASPQDSVSLQRQLDAGAAPPKSGAKADDPQVVAQNRSRNRYVEKSDEILRKFFDRQSRSVLSSKTWNAERWDQELGNLLFGLAQTFSTDAATREAARSGLPFDEGQTFFYIEKYARASAESINFTTQKLLDAVGDDRDARRSVFTKLDTTRGHEISVTFATGWCAFGTREVAYQNGNVGQKKWITTSEDSRHAALDGDTVAIDEKFSNDAAFPGDFTLPTQERAGCTCLLVIE